MRTRKLRLSLLPVTLLALAAARPATGQPCTITCPPDVTVTATGVLTPVSYTPPVISGSCGPLQTQVICSDPNGGNFPLGTTPVTCSVDPITFCQFKVNVVAPTELDVTFTEAPVVNPNPGTSIYSGASFGPFDVFYSATDQFYVYENLVFSTALQAQGFVASNAAPTDTGVKFIGRNSSDQYGTAQVDLCGGVPPAVQVATFAQQDFDFSQGVFWNGNSTGLICGATPADGKAFRVEGSLQPFYGDLPSGSRAQDVFVDGNACVVLGTGVNGIFRVEAQGTSFTGLPFTPGSGTVAPSWNLYVTDAFNPKLYELERDGQQVADYDLSAPIFRIFTLQNGNIFGFASDRTFVVFDPDFGLETTYDLSGTGNDIVDFKPTPGFPSGTNVFLRDPTVGRSFVRGLGISFVSSPPKGPVDRWRTDCVDRPDFGGRD